MAFPAKSGLYDQSVLLRRHPDASFAYYRERLATELPYFRTQRARLGYAHYQRAGLPIGSGVVEAAGKTLVTQRLKRSGMRWELTGG